MHMTVVSLCAVSSGLDDDESKNLDSSAGKDVVLCSFLHFPHQYLAAEYVTLSPSLNTHVLYIMLFDCMTVCKVNCLEHCSKFGCMGAI